MYLQRYNILLSEPKEVTLQTLDNEIKAKTRRVRGAGVRTELLVKLPNELRDTLMIKPGDQFETYFNHKGEVLFRPVASAVSE